MSVKKMQDANGIKVTKNGNLVFEGMCEYNVPLSKYKLIDRIFKLCKLSLLA